jgi:hypothetical protein
MRVQGYVLSGHDFCRERLRGGERSEGISAKLMQASLTLTATKVQSSKRSGAASYVLSVHDFCRDSAKQASLMAFTAPKNQSADTRSKIKALTDSLLTIIP